MNRNDVYVKHPPFCGKLIALAQTIGFIRMHTRIADPVTEVIAPAEFQGRRTRLMAALTDNDVAVVSGASIRYRNRDAEYPFRQDSDFYYLTGFEEPDSVLVLAPGAESGAATLFCPERDPAREQWTGERLGPERAPQALGVDAAFPNSRLDEVLPRILDGRWCVYAALGENPEFDKRLIACASSARARGAAVGACEFQPLQRLLHEQRLFKSPAEQRLMAAAGEITARAHIDAMRRCRPGLNETQLEGVLVHAFMQAGARAAAYPSIVAGGRNACVMHYVKNDSSLRDGDMVLIDAGCELQHYASDVTRTFPVNGTYAPRQRELYEIVLAGQAAALDAAVPGARCTAPQDAATRVLAQGLIDLGLLGGGLDEVLETAAYQRFTVHRCSHWLGIDVHDVGEYRCNGDWRKLEAGMVLTIEPGLYIPDSFDDIDEAWRGMGVRIEDDVVITATGNRVITDTVPKAAADIEALMRD